MTDSAPTSELDRPLLAATAISKQYQGVVALEDIHFELAHGEIHALLGGNGAGKSTLIKILSGIVKPNSGSIAIDGEQAIIQSATDAFSHGIVTIHQELSLVPALSALENIYLGRELLTRIGPFELAVNRRLMERRVIDLAAGFGISVEDLHAPVQDFGALKKRAIEIIKALAFNARVLILDEPTSGLETEEKENLFEHMRQLRHRGVSLIWVTHHLEELHGLADRCTILRDGRYIETVDTNSISTDELVSTMFGVASQAMSVPNQNTVATPALEASTPESSTTLMQLEQLTRGTAVRDITLDIRQGEVLGITGLEGAGRTELARLIMGIDRPSKGRIILNGRRVRMTSASMAYRNKLAMVPEDRKQFGILPTFSIAENISLSQLSAVSFAGIFLNGAKERSVAESYRKKLSIKAPSVDEPIMNLSGGNQQKAILARCFNTSPDLLIFDEPTQGIDIAAKAEVHALIREYVAGGGSAIVIASEPSELLDLSHRIVVMNKGRNVGTITGIVEKLKRNEGAAIEKQVLALSAGLGK